MLNMLNELNVFKCMIILMVTVELGARHTY